jgi:hypothetical protein
LTTLFDILNFAMQREPLHSGMRRLFQLLIGLGAVGLGGVAAAQTGLWNDRGGLGLKPLQREPASLPATSATDLHVPGKPTKSYELYSGARELPRLGTSVSEAYSGVAYSFSRKWGSSLEAGVTPEAAGVPRRYSLAGQLRTALSGERGVSVGLKYRQYEADLAHRGGLYSSEQLDQSGANDLAPSVLPGLYTGPSYEVRLRYQHSASSSFGLALGRDLETLTPGLDTATNGERQLMFTGQHWLTPKWGLSYDLLSDEPGGSMRVQGLRLGVRYRF